MRASSSDDAAAPRFFVGITNLPCGFTGEDEGKPCGRHGALQKRHPERRGEESPEASAASLERLDSESRISP